MGRPRNSRRLPAAALTVGVLAAYASGGTVGPARASSAARAGGCSPPGARTVSETRTIRIYRAPSHRELAPLFEYACWRPTGRSLLLGYTGSNELLAARISHVTLAAPSAATSHSSILAWEQTSTTATSASLSIMSGDVRTGRVIHETAPRGAGDLEARQFIVTPVGSLAWVGRGGPVDANGQNTGPLGVWAFGPQGEGLLAGLTEEPGPLTWAGGVLSWSLGARSLSAPLP